MKKFLFTFTFLLFCMLSFAQQIKRLHQTFEISDTINILHFDVQDTYEVEPWEGINILVEINVKLYEASAAVMNYLIESERYAIESKTEKGKLILTSGAEGRHPVKYKNTDCPEFIEIKFFIPRHFQAGGDREWVKVGMSGE